MKQIKIIPPWMCHTVFHSKLNSSDLKLFYTLIAMCSFEYHNTKYTQFIIKVKNIKKELGTDASIKASLIKLNAMKMTANFFRSYTIDKDIEKDRRDFIPFSIDFGTAKRANNITITVDKDFIDYFEEHNFKKQNGKFSLSYRYLNNLDNTQYQLLYMFLADRVAEEEGRERYVDTKNVALLMNRPRNYKLEAIKDDLRNAEAKFEEIDLDIKFKWEITEKTKPNKDGKYKSYFECKFIITRVDEQPKYKKVSQPKNTKFVKKTEYDKGLTNDEIDLANKLIVNIIDFNVEQYKVSQEKKGNKYPIRNMIAFRKTIKKDHKLEESKKIILEIDRYIKECIDTLVDDTNIKIDKNKDNSLAFSNAQLNFYQINNSYFLYENKKQITTTIEETNNFIFNKGLNPCVISNPYPEYSISSISIKEKSELEQQSNTDINIVDENYTLEEALDEIDNQCDLDTEEQVKIVDDTDKTEQLRSFFKNRLNKTKVKTTKPN